MKHTLLFPVIFLSLVVFMLPGTAAMAVDAPPSAHNIRIFFSGNVLAELEPCG